MSKNFILIGTLFFIVLSITTLSHYRKNLSVIKSVESDFIKKCYQYSKITESGLTDSAWLKMNINKKIDTINGEYRNLPAEKDSKIGSFSGLFEPIGIKSSEQIANVWWESASEGIFITEQLKIVFTDEYAFVLFGEMIDRGDGIHVYKDSTKLTRGFQMTQIDCEQLEEQLAVEKYIKENIETIITDKPVLGGKWYVVSIKISKDSKIGNIIYEDGHIQGRANFKYTFDANWEIVITIF